ncbi:unnamed protein product [Linum tenue]|uniref:Uncharacterized protein n=1 Tax=Linum tenue TaxID=586396 RepID=A0AAV0JF68_9ROSI|nr:unnamed protein product [Linum tenue]
MAGIVSMAIQQLAPILVDELKQRARLVIGAEGDVKKLTNTLTAIQALLADAEQKQLTQETVKLWIHNLKDASYDMVDVLDEWRTAILRRQLQEATEESNVDPNWFETALYQISSFQIRVCPFFNPASCCFFPVNDICLRYDIASRIKRIRERIDDISNDKETFTFEISSEVASGSSSADAPSRELTSSLMDTVMEGRDAELDQLLEAVLLGDQTTDDDGDDNRRNLQVVSLIGMGGLGKTTLAKSVYGEVKSYFDRSIWLCVSQPFDRLRIAKEILVSLSDDGSVDPYHNDLSFGQVLERIHGRLAAGMIKLFLVLDDCWEEDPEKWQELLMGALSGARYGSRVLVTTRNQNVANALGCGVGGEPRVIRLGVLSDEACFAIFSRFAFMGWGERDVEMVKDIGVEVVRQKCCGIPLSAKALGGLLRSKKGGRMQWQNVLDSKVWELKLSKEKDLFAPLWLSYYDLTPQLRQCFSYCSVFPKNFVIEKDKLIKLWMAQGYLVVPGCSTSSNDTDELERTGEQYFESLVIRSFFQDFQTVRDQCGSRVGFKMHDLVHDFAQFASSNECYSMGTDQIDGSNLTEVKVRHLSAVYGLPFESICSMRGLRSLLFLPRWGYVFEDMDTELLSRLTSLRLLDLRDCWIEELPSGIHKLIHLRMLDLSYNDFLRELPDALSDLYNLQTLDVNFCTSLERWPNGMEKLVNLTHLSNSQVWGLIPKGIGKLQGLKTLLELRLGRDNHRENGTESSAASLKDLRQLNRLQDSLTIIWLGGSSEHVEEAEHAELDKKTKLTVLSLRFSVDKEERNDGDQQQRREAEDEKVIEALRPPPNLDYLGVEFYQGSAPMSPSWMESMKFVTKIKLSDFINCVELPCLGKLPCLEALILRNFPSVKKVGSEFTGSSSKKVVLFPRLTKLGFIDFPEWEEWEEINGDGDDGEEGGGLLFMPGLRSLRLDGCTKLRKLPEVIVRMSKVEKVIMIRDCDSLEYE